MDTQAILAALRSDPRIDAAKIGVTDSGGTAVLTGSVHSYAEKCWAEELVRTHPGVEAVKNEIDVRITIGDYRTDDTLQRVVRQVFEALGAMPDVLPDVSVRDGWLTLTGTVDWPFQKKCVEDSIRQIAGIRGITNEIRIGSGRRHPHPRAERV